MARLAFILVSFVWGGAHATIWQAGSVVLARGEVLTGQISRQSNELILLRSGGKTHVLPAHRVQSFRFYDTDNNINRKFIVLCLTHAPITYYSFFETVAVGTLSVVRKQRVFHDKFDEQDATSFDFFVLSGIELSTLKSFKSSFYNLVKTKLEQRGIDASGFNPNETADALRMILLFNQLPEVPSITAS